MHRGFFGPGKVSLEISRYCRESILVKVSIIIVYIVEIMWRGSKGILSSRSRDLQKSAKSQNENKAALGRITEEKTG